MAQAALTSLPQVDLVFIVGNPCSIQSLKICANLIATLQIEASPDATYTLTGYGNNPFDSAIWEIVVSGTGTIFTCTFQSEVSSQTDTIGRAALSTRRNIDLAKATSANLASTRSLLAVINWIETMEDAVAQEGADTITDAASPYTGMPCNGNTPFDAYVWDIAKSVNAYVLTSTATS